mgnify:CR=1 FL=1
MRILIISYYFAPSNAIASIRTTKIAKYLQQLGYEVEIICGPSFMIDPTLEKDLEYFEQVYVVHGSKLYEQKQSTSSITCEVPERKTTISQNKKKLKAALHFLVKNDLADYLALFNSIIWYMHAKTVIHNTNLKNSDIILSSFGPIGSLLLAEYLKKKRSKNVWIIDYRDPIILDSQKGLLKLFYVYYQDRILNKCDISFCVSDGLKDYLVDRGNVNPIYKIPNGYDIEDIQQGLQDINYGVPLSFSYCGSLYGGRRDFSVFFKLLRELIDEKEIDEANLMVVYAGNDFSIFEKMASKYLLKGILRNYGTVSRDISLQITRSSDIALLASWNTKESKGIMTGKIYELFLLRKPIYAFISGDCKNSEIRSVMEETKAGIVYEEFGNYNYENMKQNVKKVYKQKLNNEKVTQIYDDEKVQSFSYQEIVKRIDTILKKYE